jgi:uncharacterized protein (TIGR02246 family)
MIQAHPDEQAIRKVIAEWIEASARGDYAAIEPLMHPGIIFLTAGNEPRGREQFQEGFLNIVKTMRLESTSEVREIEISGDLAYAWCWVQVRLASTSDDVNVERKGNVLSVYKRNAEGRWQLWRDANLMLR